MAPSMSRDTATLPRSTWWLLAGLTLGWGMNWPMIKLALADIPVWTFRFLCVASGAAGMFVMARLAGQPLRVPRSQWPVLAGMAFFNVTLWNVLVAYGVRSLPAGRSVILAYTMPLWTVLLSALFLHERLTLRRIVGLALGLSGLTLLLGDSLVAIGGAPLAALVVIGGAVSWSIGTLLTKRHPLSIDTTALTAWNFCLGGIPLAIGALLEHGQWRPIGTPAALALAYNIVVAFIICHWLWFRIVKLAPAGVSSLGTLTIPVVGVFAGMVVLGERPAWTDVGALCLVLASLATVLVPGRPSGTAPAGGPRRG